MIAYLNKPKIKSDIIVQLKAHAKADEIIKGQYWQNGKGCAIGCTIHSGNHAEYEKRFGIPETVAHLEDAIFEGLPNGKSKTWPVRFMSAIQVGMDMTLVWPKFAIWLLRGIIPKKTKEKEVLSVIDGVSILYERWIATGVKPADKEFDKAAGATWAARAAWAAGAPGATGATWDEYWIMCADKLIEIIKGCPIP